MFYIAVSQPIQVDTVTSIWDVLGSVGDSIGGVGAVGALLIAAIAYKRQIDDARKVQAAQIVVSWSPEQSRMSARRNLTVQNFGDKPVFDVDVRGRYASGRSFEDRTLYVLLPGKVYSTGTDSEGRGKQYALAEFTDASGRRWRRSSHGELKIIRKRLSSDGFDQVS